MATIINLPLPFTLANNTLADATQVMADFLYIVSQVNANAAGVSGTVQVDANSTLSGYLSQVLVPGTGIAFNLLNPGGPEQLQVVSTAGIFSLAQATAAALS